MMYGSTQEALHRYTEAGCHYHLYQLRWELRSPAPRQRWPWLYYKVRWGPEVGADEPSLLSRTCIHVYMCPPSAINKKRNKPSRQHWISLNVTFTAQCLCASFAGSNLCCTPDSKSDRTLTMMVAVAVAYSPPPQHSLMFGHLASSHTWETDRDTYVHVQENWQRIFKPSMSPMFAKSHLKLLKDLFNTTHLNKLTS